MTNYSEWINRDIPEYIPMDVYSVFYEGAYPRGLFKYFSDTGKHVRYTWKHILDNKLKIIMTNLLHDKHKKMWIIGTDPDLPYKIFVGILNVANDVDYAKELRDQELKAPSPTDKRKLRSSLEGLTHLTEHPISELLSESTKHLNLCWDDMYVKILFDDDNDIKSVLRRSLTNPLNSDHTTELIHQCIAALHPFHKENIASYITERNDNSIGSIAINLLKKIESPDRKITIQRIQNIATKSAKHIAANRLSRLLLPISDSSRATDIAHLMVSILEINDEIVPLKDFVRKIQKSMKTSSPLYFPSES
ncbi:MAG: hypothetical protein HN790_04230 [Methylococcales bacterium]|jgi:hypothetical protein|nr:hypothetical protein [Methylococcales bacterium]